MNYRKTRKFKTLFIAVLASVTAVSAQAITLCGNDDKGNTSAGFQYANWKSGSTSGWACMSVDGAWMQSQWDIYSYGFVHQYGRNYVNKPWSQVNRNAKANFNHSYSVQRNASNTGFSTGLYGWFTGPNEKDNVEYYIVERWGGNNPTGGKTWKGTFDMDGGTYDLYTASNRGATWDGAGDRASVQWWSVRRQMRSSGTISYGKHIEKWASMGMPTGGLLRNVVHYVEPSWPYNGAMTVSIWGITVDQP